MHPYFLPFQKNNRYKGANEFQGLDGIGADFIPEGMVYNGANWPQITLMPDLQDCHKEKIVFQAKKIVMSPPR